MSQVNANAIYDASGGQSAKLYGVSMRNGGTGWVNRIINGDMRIDQRNAGASVTQSITQTYLVDRWNSFGSVNSKFSSQQNAGSVTPPVGFTNYLGNTSLSAYTIGAAEAMLVRQYIEGLNLADLAWGTANAQAVTLSFWVRSSLTGTFSGTVKNSASNRTYPFTYTISAANTWEFETVTIPGDTTGTWLTTNGSGLALAFSLGAGASISGTANTWAGSDLYGATGAVSVVGTNGATFYITGVQLEAGSVASPFERRDYGRELQMCQRYYCKSFPVDVAPADSAANPQESIFAPYTTSNGQGTAIYYPVAMRATPTIVFYRSSGKGATADQWATYDASWTSLTSTSTASSSSVGFTVVGTRSSAFTAKQALLLSGHFTASIEL